MWCQDGGEGVNYIRLKSEEKGKERKERGGMLV
jgi:hypothetical protein